MLANTTRERDRIGMSNNQEAAPEEDSDANANQGRVSTRLDKEQLIAATADADVHQLIVGGPGSGKTGVLTRRVVFIVDDSGVHPDGVFAISYTRDASDELRSRVALSLARRTTSKDTQPAFPWCGTFHAFANWVLRTVLPGTFAILDDDAANALFEDVVADLSDEYAELRLLQPRRMRLEISRARCSGAQQRTPLAKAVATAYSAEKRRNRVADFDDLVHRLRAFLESDTGVAWARATVRHVLVDEAQDLDPTQVACLRLLSAAGAVISAVGDDAQSIYGFRGASPAHLLAFEDSFAGCARFSLATNYRSSYAVVALARGLMRGHSMLADELRAAEGAAKGVVARTYHGSEAERKAAGCEWCTGVLRRDPEASVAVLVRTNAEVGEWEATLEAAGVPLARELDGVAADAGVRLCVRLVAMALGAEKADGVGGAAQGHWCCVRLDSGGTDSNSGENSGDENPVAHCRSLEWARVLELAESSHARQRRLREEQEPQPQPQPQVSFFATDDEVADQAARVVEAVRGIRSAALGEGGDDDDYDYSEAEAVARAWDEARLVAREWGFASSSVTSSDIREADSALCACLDAALRDASHGGRDAGVEGFPVRVERAAEAFAAWIVQMGKGTRGVPGFVRCTTVHRSKGLEFDDVLLPSSWGRGWGRKRRRGGGASKSPRDPDGELDIEERRLLFVAMTRARAHLRLMEVAGTHGVWLDGVENRAPSDRA